IYTAWKKGCKFDSWGEYFRFEKWAEAFDECNVDMSFYANRKIPYDEILPWEHLDYYVSKAFFIRENKKAHEFTTTPHCRLKCTGCGVNKEIGGKCLD
ncbi:MAG: B12-binding domain-containing radical SAM protein, partial [Ruminococcus sp.]|nr:B12-binding domain-containing radical SAM protein [Ruminococcus sp.]